MGGNPFLSFLYQSIIELPAYIIGRAMGDKIGRRLTNFVSFLAVFLACFPIVWFVKDPQYEMATTILVVFVKFSISIAFFAVNLQAMETYPTCLRQSGISIGAIVANSFGVLGPYIVYLVNISLNNLRP